MAEKISIRELHLRTGRWVRKASVSSDPVIVMDRGRPAARLMPLEPDKAVSFSGRRLISGFRKLPLIESDSGKILEEDRR